MEQSSKYPRRILIDVKDVCEEAVWNPTFENEWPSTYKWFEPEEPGFNTEIVGRMFERDDLPRYDLATRQESASRTRRSSIRKGVHRIHFACAFVPSMPCSCSQATQRSVQVEQGRLLLRTPNPCPPCA